MGLKLEGRENSFLNSQIYNFKSPLCDLLVTPRKEDTRQPFQGWKYSGGKRKENKHGIDTNTSVSRIQKILSAHPSRDNRVHTEDKNRQTATNLCDPATDHESVTKQESFPGGKGLVPWLQGIITWLPGWKGDWGTWQDQEQAWKGVAGPVLVTSGEGGKEKWQGKAHAQGGCDLKINEPKGREPCDTPLEA